MKSYVMKALYAGLGVLGTGKQSVQHIGRELAKRANLSEKEGERIAKELSHQSEKVIGTLQKTLNAEVSKVVKALHTTTKTHKKHKAHAPVKAKRHHPARAKKTSA